MKKRHIITLAIIATLSGCTANVPSTDRDEDTRSSEPQDSTKVDIDYDIENWEDTTQVDFTIHGTPTE